MSKRCPAPATLAVLLVAALALAPAALAAETYEIDGVHSMVVFRIKHLGVSYSYGRFNDVSGTFALDAENPAGSSFDVTIKTESVDTHSEKRDQHLKSPDFFNATQFPVITFKSKSVKKKGEHGYQATGDLTLHGVTKEVTVDVDHVGSAKDPWGGQRSGFETVFTIKRSDFGMTNMLEGVGDEVRLMVNIEGVRK